MVWDGSSFVQGSSDARESTFSHGPSDAPNMSVTDGLPYGTSGLPMLHQHPSQYRTGTPGLSNASSAWFKPRIPDPPIPGPMTTPAGRHDALDSVPEWGRTLQVEGDQDTAFGLPLNALERNSTAQGLTRALPGSNQVPLEQVITVTGAQNASGSLIITEQLGMYDTPAVIKQEEDDTQGFAATNADESDVSSVNSEKDDHQDVTTAQSASASNDPSDVPRTETHAQASSDSEEEEEEEEEEETEEEEGDDESQNAPSPQADGGPVRLEPYPGTVPAAISAAARDFEVLANKHGFNPVHLLLMLLLQRSHSLS
jgi:hypothetical protein